FLVNDDGSLGARNDVRCVSIEHKLGIHASPTAVLAFGDREGAIAYLIGQPNRGLEYMFIMMNEARFMVGLQGVGIAERAYQQALSYAKEVTLSNYGHLTINKSGNLGLRNVRKSMAQRTVERSR